MKNEIYWATAYSDEVKFDPELPNSTFDVAIVGAGIIGLTTAFYLVKSGLKVALVGERIGGNSALSAGIISYDNEQDLSAWVENLGYSKAKTLIDILRDNASELVQMIEKNDFDSPEKNGVLVMARNASETKTLVKDVKFQEQFGIRVRILNRQDMRSFVAMKDAVAGYFNPHVAAINPYKTFRNMAKYLRENGCFVKEFCTVEDINAASMTLRTNAGVLRAKKIVIATSVNKKLTKIKKPSLKLSASLFVSEPLSVAEQHAVGWSNRQILWSVGKSFSYYRFLPDNRILFGLGTLERFGEMSKDILCNRFAAIARDHLPYNFGVKKEIEYCWSGAILVTEDMLPEISIDGNIVYAAGANLSTGHFVGKEISKIIRGEKNSSELEFMNTASLHAKRRKGMERIVFNNLVTEKLREKIANIYIQYIAH